MMYSNGSSLSVAHKISGLFIVLTMLISPVVSGLSAPGVVFADEHEGGHEHEHAEQNDGCGAQYIYTKSVDFSDDRVVIDFQQGMTQVNVSAREGYAIAKIELKVQNDGHNGFFTYATDAVDNFNPNPGDGIESARVTVKKTCIDLCPNIDGAQYIVPEGMQITDGQCSPIPPADLCPLVDGIQSQTPCADTQCTDQGGTWADNSCTIPVDMCPAVDGMQESGPCADTTCLDNGGSWVDNQCVHDVCPIDEGIQTDVAQCTPPTPVCSEDQHIEGASCVDNDPTPTVLTCPITQHVVENTCVDNPVTPTPDTGNGGGGNGGSGNGPIVGTYGATNNGNGGGEVLGASTSTVGNGNGPSCSSTFTQYMRLNKQNDPEQVKKLQELLNKELGLTMIVNGVFSKETDDAVKAFQLKYWKEILSPWVRFGHSEKEPTGYVYKTTLRMLNLINCESLNLPMPMLP